jgi:hypothetical protein
MSATPTAQAAARARRRRLVRVAQGTPEQVQRRVAQATDPVITAERWRGLGYLLVATLLVEAGIAVIAWQLVRRRRRRCRRVVRPGGEPTSSPAG